MTGRGDDWRPSASLERLRARAAALACSREFFAARGVLEVDTPLLVQAPVSEVHLHSASVRLAAAPGEGTSSGERQFFLHTSPEYAMKRLLAAGSGDIYQICHVIRGCETGRLHNAEFTLIEWYRLGFTLERLMDEVEALVRALLGARGTALTAERLSYHAAFKREFGLDPFTASPASLAKAAEPLGFRGTAATERDEWLELLMGAIVGPRLGRGALTFVYGYPSTQAALARLDPHDQRQARRFELYCEGIELANGFEELGAAAEQRARFERDNIVRRGRGLPVAPLDERLLAALEGGLPECAGVALGFDRTLMLATGVQHIEEVLTFPAARA